MHSERIRAVKTALGNNRKFSTPHGWSSRPVELFGKKSLTLQILREKLPKEIFQDLQRSLESYKKISPATADAVAFVVKEWAIQQGATHYCHWFQPLTGLTAQKHDAFLSIQNSFFSSLSVIEKFSGPQLLQGEPDASSFPSGGMRTTFEARGYTAWDPSSPFFIHEESGTRTLFIPSVFLGYHGQALDMKIPLLRALERLDHHACEFLKLLGDLDVKHVTMSLGAEQEFFLIDESFLAMRPDLQMTGRTLLGHPSARGQQFEDHYFGSIPARVKAFYTELERELYELGIPVKTRHNEVAPSQFELAPIYEDLNVAIDHNVLVMETLQRTARKFGLVCLLHEKPFAGINGSGKHCNWSLSTNKGDNLLEPGSTPHQNLRFLAVLMVVLKAIKDHASSLRLSIASLSNDLRLGANEAPPAIISVFLGNMLDQLLNQIRDNKDLKATAKEIIDLGVGRIPDVSKDYTDRNRTSPVAFTGNKFEFRAVGSSSNPSYPMMMTAAALAASFTECTKRLKKLLDSGTSRDQAVLQLIRELIKETEAIRFEGNGYSDEWRKEAQRRGLPEALDTPQAIALFFDQSGSKFLAEQKILSSDELASHKAILTERYVKALLLEARVLLELAETIVLPAFESALVHKARVGQAMEATATKGLQSSHERWHQLYQDIFQYCERLSTSISRHPDEHSSTEELIGWSEKVKVAMHDLRSVCNQVESQIPDQLWPLPKYREMLLSLAQG